MFKVDDTDAVFDGPSLYSNKIYLHTSDVSARITFMERCTNGDRPRFRTSATVSIDDLIQLRDLINRQLEI